MKNSMQAYHEIKGNAFLRGIARLADFTGELSLKEKIYEMGRRNNSWERVGHQIEKAILKYEESRQASR